ncbi:class I SAM-dependent DNA methyltransferase [Salinimicrobium sp. TH3]|uniref:class I SAM-dependent DNA methyltransferase n=1 Tax=Salinimicrobium sp. TH3 TaxID=2997342 RepID=UPI0022748D2C|nr:class I SAM-dependent methyltransferase [Salinimicrobium sp. TH3]MCY2687868.1 class I SAM-dependent methyltransferase [Salinimicrobium sp. TH3]
MKKKGINLSAQDFQEKVNVIFHDCEAEVYDEMHADMNDSLQEQIDLLVEDLLGHCDVSKKQLRVLDVGCGTGMSSNFLMNSRLKPFIAHITLLDTSSRMLEVADRKAQLWNKEYSLFCGRMSQLSGKYDLVLVCSVLHHIPDLKQFLEEVRIITNPKGIFIHLQDPNVDSLNNENYKNRVKSYRSKDETKPLGRKIKNLLPKRYRSYINRLLGRKNYIDLINDKLIKDKVISSRLTADEIWSITDIHVGSLQDGTMKGISIDLLKGSLGNFTLINQRSYGFYGKLKADLDPEFKKKEQDLINENKLDGRNISGLWVKYK